MSLRLKARGFSPSPMGTLAALAYRASPDRRLPAEAAPAPAYLATLLRGALAAGLTPEWIGRLESLAGGPPALTKR